jgi:hypothetical protein
MPKTCTGILIQETKNKECIKLVVIHIIHDAQSTQQNFTDYTKKIEEERRK